MKLFGMNTCGSVDSRKVRGAGEVESGNPAGGNDFKGEGRKARGEDIAGRAGRIRARATKPLYHVSTGCQGNLTEAVPVSRKRRVWASGCGLCYATKSITRNSVAVEHCGNRVVVRPVRECLARGSGLTDRPSD